MNDKFEITTFGRVFSREETSRSFLLFSIYRIFMRKIIIQNYLLSVSTRRVLAEIVETKTKAARLFNIIVELYGKHGDGWVLKDFFL